MTAYKFTEDEKKQYDRVAENCTLLVQGYRERIEYVDKVKYPDGREVEEKRSRHVKHPGLLDQLQEFVKHRDADLEPKAARGAPRIKKAKTNPELNGFLTLDEIACDIYMSLDRVFEEGDRDRTWINGEIRFIIGSLPTQMRYFAENGRPDLVRRCAQLTGKWVAAARRTLNHTVSDAMLGETVCGNCGGGLIVPSRVNADDCGIVVRCAGTPSTPSCGTEYPATEWLALYEGRPR